MRTVRCEVTLFSRGFVPVKQLQGAVPAERRVLLRAIHLAAAGCSHRSVQAVVQPQFPPCMDFLNQFSSSKDARDLHSSSAGAPEQKWKMFALLFFNQSFTSLRPWQRIFLRETWQRDRSLYSFPFLTPDTSQSCLNTPAAIPLLAGTVGFVWSFPFCR